jgi:methionyl aminopeptidase
VITRLRGNDPCWCRSGRKLKRCHGDAGVLRRPPVRAGFVGPSRPVPASIAHPPYVGSRPAPAGVERHAGESLDRLRHAGHVAASVLLTIGDAVAPGVTTAELDALAHDTCVALGAYPSTRGYKGYRHAICTSVNEVVCHGIPDDRPLQDGDIVNLDFTAYVGGVHGDNSATFPVGEVSAPARALIDVTRRATLAGIAAVAPGRPLSAVAEAVQSLASAHGYGVVADYGGHGIGGAFHAAPHVSHVIGGGPGPTLEPGMVFTVEPMLTAGVARHNQWDDGWTEVTDDGLPSAQFEHTVVVTDDGVEILTVTEDGRAAPGLLQDVARR